MVEDLHELFMDECIPKASIIGHSMGGKTAMHFAKHYPNLINKLIIVYIAPLSGSNSDVYKKT